MISSKTESGLLVKERIRKDIVIGAPHHAVGGVPNLPCKEHKDSDENLGFIAEFIASKLQLSSLVGCNATIDYNKSEDNEYYKKIKEWNPQWLIEIHGHGGNSTANTNIEISCGMKKREQYAITFASILNRKLQEDEELSTFVANGNFDDIFFKARNTRTINTEEWDALHIELPKGLRVADNNELPSTTNRLVNYIEEAISEVCIG